MKTNLLSSNGKFRKLRFLHTKFNFCLFCDKLPNYVTKRSSDVFPIGQRFPEYNIIIINDRNDEWDQEVLAGLKNAQDLHVADVVYHQQCSVNNRNLKQIPQSLIIQLTL
ncbi:hypothetical protein KUTeg_010067, partial [Tegillarca granosa]